MSQTIIDDQDLSHVKYNGTWIRGGSSREHDGTVASSTQVNDSFTVSFSGNSIAVYGTIDSTSGGVLTNYSVDGASPAQATSQAGVGDTENQQFWKSPTLNEGNHNLVVTMVKVNPESQPDEGTVWFDYFLVTDPRIQSSPTTKSKNIGAIVGGTIGGVIVMISISLVIIALVLRRRRNKRQLNHIQPWPHKEAESGISCAAGEDALRTASSHPTVEPFPLREENQIFNATTSLSTTSGKVTMTHQPSLSITSSSTSPSSTLATDNVITPNPASRKRQGGGTPTPAVITVLPSSSSLPEPAIQHVDSGVRVANMDASQTPSGPVELPPVYSPV